MQHSINAQCKIYNEHQTRLRHKNTRHVMSYLAFIMLIFHVYFLCMSKILQLIPDKGTHWRTGDHVYMYVMILRPRLFLVTLLHPFVFLVL